MALYQGRHQGKGKYFEAPRLLLYNMYFLLDTNIGYKLYCNLNFVASMIDSVQLRLHIARNHAGKMECCNFHLLTQRTKSQNIVEQQVLVHLEPLSLQQEAMQQKTTSFPFDERSC